MNRNVAFVSIIVTNYYMEYKYSGHNLISIAVKYPASVYSRMTIVQWMCRRQLFKSSRNKMIQSHWKLKTKKNTSFKKGDH